MSTRDLRDFKRTFPTQGYSSRFLAGLERPEWVNPIQEAENNHAMGYGIPTNQDEEDFVANEKNWKVVVLRWLHWKPVQMALLMMLLLDVFILFVEVFLMSLFPACGIIERDAISCCPYEGATHYDDDHHRFLGGGGGDDHLYCDAGLKPKHDYTATCDDHKWHVVHEVEEVLFGVTIFILSTFMVELTIEMIALTPCVFFRQFFYLLDYTIITTSLVLELSFHFLDNDKITSVVGLLVIARVWRFVRIGHGIVGITTEVNHEKFLKLLAYTEKLEEILEKEELEMPDRPAAMQDASTREDDPAMKRPSSKGGRMKDSTESTRLEMDMTVSDRTISDRTLTRPVLGTDHTSVTQESQSDSSKERTTTPKGVKSDDEGNKKAVDC